MKDKTESYMIGNNEFKTKFIDKYFYITNHNTDKIARPKINKIFENSSFYDDMKKKNKKVNSSNYVENQLKSLLQYECRKSDGTFYYYGITLQPDREET